MPNAKKLKDGRVALPNEIAGVQWRGLFVRVFVSGSPEDGGHHARQQEQDEERRPLMLMPCQCLTGSRT